MWPSLRNRSGVTRAPDHYYFNKTHENTDTLRLLFCGDIMVQNKDAIPALHPELCELIQSADLFIGNCEAPLGNHQPNHHIKYGFIFNMPRYYLENIIQQTGLPPAQWLLSTANNHTGDIDYAAYSKTYDILTDMGVTPLGRYTEDDLPLRIVHHKGLRIGFVVWTEWMNRDIFTDHPGVFRHTHVMNHNWRMIKSNHQLDYLFGVPHWEYEFQHYPHQQTRTLAKTLIDEKGIDFLVGVHTHTLQPMEWFEYGMCAYNLGNFCGFGRAWSVKLIPLLEVRLNLHKNAKNRLDSYRLHYFYQQCIDNKTHIIPLQLAPLAKQNRLRQLIGRLYESEHAT
jgi:hypothetical protein